LPLVSRGSQLATTYLTPLTNSCNLVTLYVLRNMTVPYILLVSLLWSLDAYHDQGAPAAHQ